MSLNIIDISSHQASIDLAALFAQNPLDGVIVKSTQYGTKYPGNMYINPYCDIWVQWLIENNKPWGFYHYLDGTNPIEEARLWVQHTFNYWGRGVPCADFEANIVSRGGVKYLQQFLETAYAETGVKPFVYCSLSTIQSHKKDFEPIAAAGYPLWLAQYASATQIQHGFNPSPWQRGSYAPFDKITMHQYSSLGRLNGYPSNLDFDLFYGDKAAWNAFAAKEGVQPDPEPTPDPTPTPSKDENISRAIELLEVAITLLNNVK